MGYRWNGNIFFSNWCRYVKSYYLVFDVVVFIFKNQGLEGGHYQPNPIIFDTSNENLIRKCPGEPACSGNGFCLPNSNKCICNSNFTGEACNCEHLFISIFLVYLLIEWFLSRQNMSWKGWKLQWSRDLWSKIWTLYL